MKRFNVYLCCLMLIASASRTRANEPFEFRDGDRIVFLGDSITQNGDYPRLVECYLLSRFPAWKLTFRNVAWNSDRAWLHQRMQDINLNGDVMLKTTGEEQEQLRARMVGHGLARDVLPLQPSVVMIMFGANDVRDGEHALRLHIASLQDIVTKLRQTNCRVIVLSASPEEPGSEWNVKHEQFAAAVHAMAEREKVTFVDIFHPVLKAVQEAKRVDASFGYTTDGVHPRPAGHLMIARAILQGLGLDPSTLSGEPTALLAKITEKNKAYFHRWREIEIPALVAGKLETSETRAQLADADKRIRDLEAQIDVLREAGK